MRDSHQGCVLRRWHSQTAAHCLQLQVQDAVFCISPGLSTVMCTPPPQLQPELPCLLSLDQPS